MKHLHALRIRVTLFLVLAALPSMASAADLYLLGGAVHSFSPDDASYSWQLEYRQDLWKHLALGVSYLNEGHVPKHHRDGYSPQLWARTELMDYRLTLAAGVGPYFFLDTESKPNIDGYSNEHGIKAIVSLAAAWHTQRDWTFELRSNYVAGPDTFDTLSVLAGIGYHFDPETRPLVKDADLTPKNEVTLFLGETIVNSFESQDSVAVELEYRRTLARHLEWTVSGLYEGDNRLVRRDGIMTQLWASQELREGMFAVAAGGGLYLNVAHLDHSLDEGEFVAGVLSLTGTFRLNRNWGVRATWNRLVTTYDRDTDVILAGVGYRF